MSVEKTNEIDAAGTEKNGKKLCLAIFDSTDWSDLTGHLMLLQEKINAYLSFIESEQYKESFGDGIKEFEISIKFVEKIPGECKKFLNVVNKQLKKEKIKVVF